MKFIPNTRYVYYKLFSDRYYKTARVVARHLVIPVVRYVNGIALAVPHGVFVVIDGYFKRLFLRVPLYRRQIFLKADAAVGNIF